MDIRLIAANEYANLKARRINPEGRFDKGGRFWLEENLSCCNVRQPSRAFPFSLLVHARTAEHVATKYGVAASDIKKIAKYMVV